MKTILVAAAVVMAMTSPAFAKHCPKDAQIVKEAMSKATGLSEKKMSLVKALHDMGVAAHKSGNHADSITVLHAATTILGVKPYMKPM